MNPILKLLVGSQDEYDALEVKDSNALYFIIDTHRIYRGSLLFASGLIENLAQNDSFELFGGTATDVIKEGE